VGLSFHYILDLKSISYARRFAETLSVCLMERNQYFYSFVFVTVFVTFYVLVCVYI